MKIANLPQNVVEFIVQFILEKRQSVELITKFPNPILRSDVLELLDVYCTVVYYPKENESNNGFHVTGILDRLGNEKHFVYINTNQTIDKQIFTAAHELGHAWEVDRYVLDKFGESIAEFDNENIINRFAAELLMPKEQFLAFFDNEYQKYKSDDGKLSLTNLLKIIVVIMNQFMVPQKAVICRLYEVGKINLKTLGLLLGEELIPEDSISNYIVLVLRENGFDKLLTPNHKKHIDGLAELLDIAEKKQTVTSSKIEKMRQLFDIPAKHVLDDGFDKIVDVQTSEGEIL